jgi:HK97 family phage major capsid protein
MKDTLEKKLKGLIDQINTIEAKGEQATDEDFAAYKSATDEIKQVRSQLETVASAEEQKAWANQERPNPAVSAKKASFENSTPAGTVLITRNEDGSGSVEDDSHLDERTAKAIREPSYKNALRAYMKGKEDVADLKALSEGTDTLGGYLVPPEFIDQIIKRRPQAATLMNLVRTIPTIRDRVVWPRVDYTTDDIYDSPIRIQWPGEGGSTAAEQDINWGQTQIDVNTGLYQIEVSRDILEDTPQTLEAVLTSFGRTAYDLGMENVILTGSGVGRPFGILFNPGASLQPPTVNIGNPTTAASLISFIYGLAPQYQANASVLMNSTAMATYGQIQDTSGSFVMGLVSRQSGLADRRVMALLGFPINVSAFMPSPGSANQTVVYGDFEEAYTLVSRKVLSIETYGQGDKEMVKANRLGYNFRFRAGGAITQGRALRVGVQS